MKVDTLEDVAEWHSAWAKWYDAWAEREDHPKAEEWREEAKMHRLCASLIRGAIIEIEDLNDLIDILEDELDG